MRAQLELQAGKWSQSAHYAVEGKIQNLYRSENQFYIYMHIGVYTYVWIHIYVCVCVCIVCVRGALCMNPSLPVPRTGSPVEMTVGVPAHVVE